MHRLSIVTVTYNSARYLEDTLRSVSDQTWSGIEYIVVDGGSTDGSIDIIKRYEARIDKWISEPDEGISDAMNKGIALASGEFIYFLHSDDYLESSTAIEQACAQLEPGRDIFLFSIYLDKNGEKTLRRPRGFSWWTNFKTGVYHQSVICRKSLFDEIGGFDTGLRIAMDYDFFLRAYRHGARTRTADIALATMRLVGISSRTDWPSLSERFREERMIHSKQRRSNWMLPVYAVYWMLYLPYRRLRHLAAGAPG